MDQKRAVIVGETTGGGAHPVSGHRVADYFMVGVPFAKSLDRLATIIGWVAAPEHVPPKAPPPAQFRQKGLSLASRAAPDCWR